MDDYERRKKRLEKEIEMLHLRKSAAERNLHKSITYKRGPGLLFWIFILVLIVCLLYQFGLIDLSPILKQIGLSKMTIFK